MLPQCRSLHGFAVLPLAAGARVCHTSPVKARDKLASGNHAKVLPCRL